MDLYEKVASHIANTCLNVKKGEEVLIAGGVHQFDLLSRIAIHVRKAGAHPTMSITNDDMYVRMMTEVDEAFLVEPPDDHAKYMAALYDAAIHIDSIVDDSIYDKVPGELLAKKAICDKPLRDIKFDAKRRTIAMSWPTKRRAERAGLSMEAMEELFWKALLIDLNEMQELSTSLEEIYEKGSTVHITSEKGSDITFSIENRRVMVDGGHYTEEMVKKGDCMKNLPCGEVYTTAVESTPEGLAVFDAVFLKGCVIENLRCMFKGGKLVESSADKNHEVFLELWNNASGDKDQIAEFAIGTNPEITRPIGDSLFDEKIYGSVHLAIGENKFFGGLSTSSIHWDFVMQKPTVKIDEKVVLEKGKFLVP